MVLPLCHHHHGCDYLNNADEYTCADSMWDMPQQPPLKEKKRVGKDGYLKLVFCNTAYDIDKSYMTSTITTHDASSAGIIADSLLLGKTVIKEQFSEVPLCVQRAMYCEESLPSMAYLYIASVSGGLLQGDKQIIDIHLEPHSMAHITTQGATRIHGSSKPGSLNSQTRSKSRDPYGILKEKAGDPNIINKMGAFNDNVVGTPVDVNTATTIDTIPVASVATQTISISVDEKAYLEFLPDQIIPYKNSQYIQKTKLVVHDSATLVYSEILTPGRVGMGESFVYDKCHIRTLATNQHQRPRLWDAVLVLPATQQLSSFGILDTYDIVGSVYILTPKKYIDTLYKKINSIFIIEQVKKEEKKGGASITHDDSGILVRILANHTEPIKETISNIAALVRYTVLNALYTEPRKS